MAKMKVIAGVKDGKPVLQIQQPLDERKVEEERILNKYPKIFRQKDLPMTQTCMCWGLATGKGWFKLIDALCGAIQSYIDNNSQYHPEIKQIEAVQVKEKFGGLRFYTDGGECDVIQGMIWFAEHLSYHICEECGTMDDVTTNDKGYIVTLCNKCREGKNEKNRKDA